MFGNRHLQHHSLSVLLNTAFDPDQFASMPIEGVNSTEGIPFENEECPGVIDSIGFRTGTGKDGKPWTQLDVFWSLESPTNQQNMDREKLIGRQSMFLERLESGALDMGKGKNVDLGQLREATGLNRPGEPFSFNMLIGQAAICDARDREYEGKHFIDVKKVHRR